VAPLPPEFGGRKEAVDVYMGAMLKAKATDRADVTAMKMASVFRPP
jgi:hypothetical protein